MSDLEQTLLLILAIAGLGWVVYRVVAGLGAKSESSARADTLGHGKGFGAEQMDNIRNFDR